MANHDWPRGLRPIKNVNGDAPVIEELDCVTTLLYEGAPLVFSNSTGLVSMHTSSTFSSAEAKFLVGVCVAPKPAGASENKALVYTDPDQLYTAQHATDTLTTLADVLAKPYFNMNALNTGSGTTLDSKCEITGAGSSTNGSSVADFFLAVGVYKGGAGGAINAVGDNVTLVGKIDSKFHIRG